MAKKPRTCRGCRYAIQATKKKPDPYEEPIIEGRPGYIPPHCGLPGIGCFEPITDGRKWAIACEYR
jgi:hypothetical protein